jgi:nitrate/nitrite transporter NarK
LGVASVTAADKWLTMFLLCLSGSVVYWQPFFSDIYYVPMQNAFGFSNTQIGMLMSVFGTTSLIGYFPGGWLADRFSPRKLICSALLIISAGSFVFSTIPSFAVCVFLYAMWGLAVALVFWSAMIKSIRNWGRKDEQGRAYGILEGGRSVTDLASGTILLAFFAFRGGDYGALGETIVIQASVPLVLAAMVWLIMKDDVRSDRDTQEARTTISLAVVKEVLKLPMVWLLATIILTAYSGYWGSAYFAAYATKVYELGDVLGGAIGVSKYWIAPVAAIAAGFVADRIGTAKAVVTLFILMTSGFLVFGLVPGAPVLVPLLLVNVAVVSTAVFALRGIYFALMEQGSIPMAVTGTAVGLVSVIGYTPDIFLPPLAGVLLDAYPGAQGFQIYFLIIGGLNFVGLMAAYGAYRRIQSGPA